MPNRPPRLPEFPYLGLFRYFLTVCVRHRRRVFDDVALGRFVASQFLHIAPAHGFEVIAYCVMPDHFHAMVAGERDDAALGALVHRWKQATGFAWRRAGHREPLWQEGFYDRILREEDLTEAVVRYVVANPLRAGLVDDVRDYPLIGAGNYDLDALLELCLDWDPRPPPRRCG